MMDEGWLKIHRCLLKKSIWKCSTPEQKVILITLLLMANYSRNEWEWNGNKYECKSGEFITSAYTIIEKAGKGISRQNIRTALDKFQKFGFLTYESTNTSTKVIICNWGTYQDIPQVTNQVTNQVVTNDQPTTNQPLTTIEECNNVKNDNNLVLFPPSTIEKFDFEDFIKLFNSIVNAKFRGDKKSKSQFEQRLTEGYSKEDLKIAIQNAFNNDYHKENPQYLTPEFITRPDKLERYLNIKEKTPVGAGVGNNFKSKRNDLSGIL